MASDLFAWYSDIDGDNTLSDETVRYSSTYWLPNIDLPHGGRKQRHAAYPTLDGEVMHLTQGRAGCADGRAPGLFTLSWEWADPDFIRLAEEDYAKGRRVGVRLDHRWRQLEVTSSGAADLKVTVSAGYVHSGGDTYWLAVDVVVTCGASDTYVYAELAAGVVTVDSGTSVPAGAVELATITIAASVVTVTSALTGVANMREGVITEFEPNQAGGYETGLTLTIQELR